ncbi:hypothetical protein SAMN04488102_103117 [Alkalibacterium subtropicum]|uniref:Extracellular solute-binding protein n=1 Tax=Alkalibacterium subtropicum TaxID=753702 RepID=A0A1I1GRL3_9LACT|nr:hypothetical protein [Alkalibacterium subtropicum]SFC11883.1 hypothetical protein SAMN04488102_103117 [Alkalibacterium subtropicum]
MAKTKVREILQSNDTPKEKADYLWGYYRWHVIIAVSGLFFAGYLLVDWINRPVTIFHLGVLASEVDYEEEQQLTEALNELMQPEGRKETAYATFTPHGRSVERFLAQFSAGEYDVILMNEMDSVEYAAQDSMMTYRVNGMSEDDYFQPEDSEEPIGIHSDSLPVFDGYQTTEDMIVMIPENTRRRDAIETFFETQGYTLEFIDDNE